MVIVSFPKASKYDQEIPPSHTANQPKSREQEPQKTNWESLSTFYWYQTFVLDSVVVKAQQMLSSDG